MDPTELIGKQVREYKFLGILGQGGMAAVLKVEHKQLRTFRAIKVIKEGLSGNKQFHERFKQEAQILVHLSHPNLVQIYDFFEENGLLFLVMQYVPGETLSAKLKRRFILKPDEVIPLMIQALDGLSAAHAKGIIHRDISPDNLMLSMVDGKEHVTIIDFGIAKALVQEEFNESFILQLTSSGAFTGKFAYCSPEQAGGLPLDARSDIYSLGLVMHRALTGVVPFHEDTPIETAAIRRQVDPPWLSDVWPEGAFSHNIELVVRRALERKPEHRYQSAAEFKDALEGLVGKKNQGYVSDEALRQRIEDIKSKKALKKTTTNRSQYDFHESKSFRRRYGGLFAGLSLFILVLLLFLIKPQIGNKAASLFSQATMTPVPSATALPSKTPTNFPTATPSPIPSATPISHKEKRFPQRTATPTPTPVIPTITPEMTKKPRAPKGFVLISPGNFIMGSPYSEKGHGYEEQQHRVKITHAYYLGETEVTQKLWNKVMRKRISHFYAPNRPVETVTWWDAVIFCNRYSKMQGLKPCYYADDQFHTVFDGIIPVASGIVYWEKTANGYRLPTEAEWEYACRAGTKTPFYTGMDLTDSQADFDGNRPYNDIHYRSPAQTVPVKNYPPNPWGLFDMHGNVWEWCWDFFENYSSIAKVDPAGPPTGTLHIRRGGSWVSSAAECRSAARGKGESGSQSSFGFRLARNADYSPAQSR